MIEKIFRMHRANRNDAASDPAIGSGSGRVTQPLRTAPRSQPARREVQRILRNSYALCGLIRYG